LVKISCFFNLELDVLHRCIQALCYDFSNLRWFLIL
jgi:hypothetical protein